MSLVHPNGLVCAVSELDLHAVSVTQKDIIKSQVITKTTNNALTDNTETFDFTFESSALYTDLSEAELYLEVEVVNADGDALTVAVEAAPVNNLAHALFDSVQLLVNNEKVTGNNDEYALKAQILDVLGVEQRDKDTRLKGCQKWMADTAGHMDVRAAANVGWTKRRAEFSARRTHALLMRPHLDMLKQCKLLPSNCPLKFIFERSSPEFYMVQAADQTFKVRILKAEMSLRQVVVRDEVVLVHNKAVMTRDLGPFNYPITRVKVTKHTLDPGSQEYSWSQPDTTQIPSRLVLALVKETASSGTKTENPFNFQHYSVREAAVKFDDQKFEVKTNFGAGNTVRAYNNLFRETGLLATGLDCGITLEDFQAGYTLLAFDLTPDKAPEAARINLLKQGKLNISLRFQNATGHAVSVIVCSFYDNIVQLTADRLPVTDYYMT